MKITNQMVRIKFEKNGQLQTAIRRVYMQGGVFYILLNGEFVPITDDKGIQLAWVLSSDYFEHEKAEKPKNEDVRNCRLTLRLSKKEKEDIEKCSEILETSQTDAIVLSVREKLNNLEK